MSRQDDIETLGRAHLVGIDWGDIGKNVFGGVHTAGKIAASAFGFGGVANQLEQVESPILPDWAKTGELPPPPPRTSTVLVPDFVVVSRTGASQVDDPIASPAQVVVTGGKRFAGTGYRSGDGPGKKFSFGFDSPTRVDVVTADGKKTIVDAKIVLLYGGQEQAHVVGGERKGPMQRIDYTVIGEWDASRSYGSGDCVTYRGVRYCAKRQPMYGIDPQHCPDWKAVVGDVEDEINFGTDVPDFGTESPDFGDDVIGADQGEVYVGARRQLVDYEVLGANIHGTAVLAANARGPLQRSPSARMGFTVKNLPNKRSYTAVHVGVPKTHKDSILNARDAGLKAQSIGKKLLAMLSHHVVGAVRNPARYSRAQHFTLAQLRTIANAAVKAGGAAVKGAKKHEDFMNQQVAKLTAGVKAVQARTDPSHHTVVGYDPYWREVVGEAGWDEVAGGHREHRELTGVRGCVGAGGYVDEIVGLGQYALSAGAGDTEINGDDYSVGVDASGLMFGQPGYNPATDPSSPQYQGAVPMGGVDANGLSPGMPGYDPTTDPSSPQYQGGQAGGLDPSMDPSQNYGLGPPPTTAPPAQPGIDFAPDPGGAAGTDADHQQTYTSTPDGAIVYDGKVKQWNHNDVVSAVAPYGDTGAGSGEGASAENPSSDDYSMGLRFQGGFRWHNDGWWYNWNGDLQRPSSSENTSMPTMAQSSMHHHWGPMIGNPSRDFKNLRYDAQNDVWFWFYDTAPDWARANVDLARLNKAVLDYQAAYAAAAANAAAQAAQDKLDADNANKLAKQQAAEDAAMQRAQDVETQKESLAQQQAQAQQDLSMQQLDTQQAQAAQQYDAQMQQLDVAQQQAFTDYLKTNPDAMASLVNPGDASAQGGDQGGGGDQGQQMVDWGGGDVEAVAPAGQSDENIDWGDDQSRDQMPA
jgi:hypothetical protein